MSAAAGTSTVFSLRLAAGSASACCGSTAFSPLEAFRPEAVLEEAHEGLPARQAACSSS